MFNILRFNSLYSIHQQLIAEAPIATLVVRPAIARIQTGKVTGVQVHGRTARRSGFVPALEVMRRAPIYEKLRPKDGVFG